MSEILERESSEVWQREGGVLNNFYVGLKHYLLANPFRFVKIFRKVSCILEFFIRNREAICKKVLYLGKLLYEFLVESADSTNVPAFQRIYLYTTVQK